VKYEALQQSTPSVVFTILLQGSLLTMKPTRPVCQLILIVLCRIFSISLFAVISVDALSAMTVSSIRPIVIVVREKRAKCGLVQ